jgi:hypothetical protein
LTEGLFVIAAAISIVIPINIAIPEPLIKGLFVIAAAISIVIPINIAIPELLIKGLFVIVGVVAASVGALALGALALE